MSESTLTQTVGTRIRPAVIAELKHYAALDGKTPSNWISTLVTREINRRKAAADVE